jgi:acyl-ACP thioesterase
MTSRNEYLDSLLMKYSGARIEHRRKQESSEIAFENNGYEVVVTVPDALDVREYFINISRESREIYSDWNDIYKVENETDEELEQIYRNCLSEALDKMVKSTFTVVVKGKNSAKNDIIFD